MDERIKRELNQANPTEFHKKMLQHCKALVTLSRGEMETHYAKWDAADQVYRGERYTDDEDKKACEKGAPQKIVLPLTYAQIQTFIAFSMNLLQQREFFYELEGTGEEDHRAAKLAEALLDQNLTFNKWTQLLYQFFLDIGRFSIGVMKTSWVHKTEVIWKEVDSPKGMLMRTGELLGSFFGMPQTEPEKVQVKEEQTAYMGNEIRSISPYLFFPDPRVPLCRFQEGEFCASEEEVTRTSLKRGEKDDIYAGVKHIQAQTTGQLGKRRATRVRQNTTLLEGQTTSNNVKSSVIITEVQLEIIPNEFMLADGHPMGDSDTPEKWVVVYANDTRVIRCEPLGYVHNHYTYSVGQMSPDQHGHVNESITEMISHLQAVIDWFINSHVTNVRKHISNRLVVDPSGIFYEDVLNHRPVIRLKPDMSQMGVDRFVKQLNVSDVTRNHISDVEVLMKFVSMTTAVSDNLMGQYHTGRRSAREAGNTATASGTRLRTIVKLLFDTAFRDLGQDMISNLRDGLTEDTFVTITGTDFPDWDAYKAFKVPNSSAQKIPVNRTNIAGRYDFKLFEGTLPSEKFAQAETLEQTLLALMKNPDGLTILTQMLGYDPQKLFTEVLTLRGIKHPARFQIDEFRQQQLMQAQQQKLLQEQQANANPQLQSGGAGAGVPGAAAPQPIPAGQPTFSALID
jgi:hypothetical protein